jgi:hypothetical protein
MPNESDRVVPLSRLDDVEVVSGDPDVRGWEVVAADGRRLGRVDELLVDTGAMKVRYLEVGVDPALLAGDRHVLIPVGYTRLQRHRTRVVVDELRPEQLQSLPPRTDETPDPEPVVPDSRSWGRPMVDPLAEARWGQVRGDEEGILNGDTTEVHPADDTGIAPPLPGADTDPAIGGLTGGMGDPGGER